MLGAELPSLLDEHNQCQSTCASDGLSKFFLESKKRTEEQGLRGVTTKWVSNYT
jgi:hypothetical protein